MQKRSKVKHNHEIQRIIFSGVQEKVEGVQSVCGEIRDGARSLDCAGCMRNTCSCNNFKSKFPIMKWLPKYRYYEHLLIGDVESSIATESNFSRENMY